MKRKTAIHIHILATMILLAVVATTAAKNVFTHRFIRASCASSKESDIAEKKEILQRAVNVGYNGFFYDDSKMAIINTVGSSVINRMKDITAFARSKGMVVVPMSFGQLSPVIDDIQNAEGFPVVGTPFVVNGGTARVQSDHSTGFKDGAFETGNASWKLAGGGISFGTGRSGKGLYFNDPARAKAVQELVLKKARAYEITCWVKTANYSIPDKICVDVYDVEKRYYLLKRVYASFATYEDKWGSRPGRSQGWKKYRIDFNSMGSEAAELWVRATPPGRSGKGEVWIDDLNVEEVGLRETVRRSSMAVTVKSQATGTIYEEGQDFTVGDRALTIPLGSAIKNGEALRVDWFQRGDMIGSEPAASFCHAEAWKSLYGHARVVQEVFGTEGVFAKYSEWRTAFWDPACHFQYGRSLPAYQGGVQRHTNDMLRSLYGNCSLPLYLWSDTYDPYHNSKKGDFYQVNGATYGNWNYLDPKTIIMNWNVHNKVASHLFFAGKDPVHKTKTPFKQIMSVYLGSTTWLDVLDQAEAKGLQDNAVIGINYCTWSENYYGGIEPFAAAAKKAGRWLSGPVPKDPVTTNCTLKLPDTTSGGHVIGIANKPFHSNNPAMRFSLATVNNGLQIQYTVSQNGHVELTAHNMLGQKAAVLVNCRAKAGAHQVNLDRTNLSTGIYFLTLSQPETGSKITKKIILM